MKLRTCIGLASSLMLFASAHASPVLNGFGLSSPDQTLDFEGVTLPAATPIAGQFAGAGVLFQGAFWNPVASGLYPNILDNHIGNFQPGVGDSPFFAIDFAVNQSAVAFALVTAPGVSTIQALLNGLLVESAVVNTSTSDPINFYGFSDIVFNQITIRVVSFDRALVLDSLQNIKAPTEVPEPGTWALSLGAVGLAAAASRRRPVSKTRKLC